MLTIIISKWKRQTHLSDRIETDYKVMLGDTVLAVFSTYSTDCKPKQNPAIAAVEYKAAVAAELLNSLSSFEGLILYREGSAPFEEASNKYESVMQELRHG